MSQPIDISIIIPFYNAEAYIERCIAGLLAQDYPAGRFEIIMIDNNSPDRSVELVRRYPAVRLLHEPTQGAYAARNTGVRAARGRILAFTDPDCVPDRDWLTQLAGALEAPEVELVVGQVYAPADAGPLHLLMDYEHTKEAHVLSCDDPTLYFGHTNNLAVTRTAFERCGPFVERARGSDTILVRRIVDALGCGAVRYAPQARVEHLEVHTLRDYFHKITTYGKSRRQYASIITARPLNSRERWMIYRRTIRRMGYSPLRSLALLGLLGWGVGCWYAGSWQAMRQQRRTRGAASAGFTAVAPRPECTETGKHAIAVSSTDAGGVRCSHD
jgi:glycosyltransferase involved in cell wall biosynthesis